MKLTKLSIAAVLAVSCVSAVNAKPLSEAIKNVDFSGTVAYRYNDYEDGATQNNYKVATSIKSKVTDDVTFNSRILVESFGMVTNTGDANVNVVLSEANFAYTGINNASITVGKQGVATPFTVARDAMGDETTGTGILATYALNPVTFAAGYFNQTDMNTAGKDIATVGVMASFAGINADAWYIDVADTADAYTVGLNASYDVAGINLSPSVRYSDADSETTPNAEISTLKADITAKLGMFDAYLGYGETGKNGGVALDGNSSDTTFDQHWRVGLLTQADSEILFANAGAQVTKKVHVSLRYSKLDTPAGTANEEETYGQVVYSHSSNLLTYVRFGEYDVDGQEAATSGRLHVQYSF